MPDRKPEPWESGAPFLWIEKPLGGRGKADPGGPTTRAESPRTYAITQG